MIGILPGEMWRTPDDCIHVVGAHWDTVKNTRGLDDNSSGVAAILEMVRALYHGECENKYTVIIVAFDLEEFGSQGSVWSPSSYMYIYLINLICQAQLSNLPSSNSAEL